MPPRETAMEIAAMLAAVWAGEIIAVIVIAHVLNRLDEWADRREQMRRE